MKRMLIAVLAATMVVGCTPIERQAYNTIVSAKAFLDSIKSKHPECPAAGTTLCVDLVKATAAKDSLIDAVEVYCASKSFDTDNGACTPPNKSDPAYQQLADKLQSAISGYTQSQTDLKTVVN